MTFIKSLISIIFLLTAQFLAQNSSDQNPIEYVYANKGGMDLKSYVFLPGQLYNEKPRAAIVIFHGGGWVIGEASWAFGLAQHFANLGMVGVAAQYRLSNQKDITPIEAMEDARDVIGWVRLNANTLKIDLDKIAAYGWSAGAHLAASAAIFIDSTSKVNCVPNALVLFSPAVSLANDGWVKKILMARTDAKNISPDEHVRSGMPPTIILQGRDDTVTPLNGVKIFTNKMLSFGNRCELNIYDNVGHLFTPKDIPDYNQPQPDPKVSADALEKADKFLISLGFIK